MCSGQIGFNFGLQIVPPRLRPLMTPAKGVNSQSFNAESSGGSSPPCIRGPGHVAALAAAEAAKSTLSKAVEAAERATGEARHGSAGTGRGCLCKARAERVTASSAPDLAVLRDECQSLRMKVLDMEEDARVSPSPRKGGMSDERRQPVLLDEASRLVETMQNRRMIRMRLRSA